MPTSSFNRPSRSERIRELSKAHAAARRIEPVDDCDDPEQLIRELQLHKAELEAQNEELRASRDLIEESQRRFSDLYDHAPVGYCMLDHAGCITQINAMGAAMLGSFKEWAVGHRLVGSAIVQEKGRFFKHLQRCRNGEEYVATELMLSTGGNRTSVVQMISTPWRALDGTVSGYQTALVDVTPLKTLERKLRFLIRAGARLASPLDAHEALATAARLATEELCDICMIDVHSAAGQLERTRVLFRDPRMQTEFGERLMAALRPRPDSLEVAVIGSSEPVLVDHGPDLGPDLAADEQNAVLRRAGRKSTIVVPLTASGRVLGALTLVSTQAERRYATEDLDLAAEFARRIALALENAGLQERARSEIRARQHLLSAVSHDLRGPLGAVLMGLDLLLEAPPDADHQEYRKVTESMHRAATRMQRLIGDLLDVSTVEAGHFRFQWQRHSLEELVAEAVEHHEAAAQAKGTSLTCDIDDSAKVELVCDRGRILQVFSNLLGNAIKFTVAGQIRIRASVRGKEVVLSVEDSGCGISADGLPHVFERFWRDQASSKDGNGLGLSIARGIIEAHGGQIWAESQEGVGTTFSFTLPSAAAFDAVVVPMTSAVTAARTVLIVDDDPDVRLAVGHVLSGAEYAVRAAANGQEALEELRQNGAPDLIILDLVMPLMNGWQFLAERNVDETLRSVPVLVASAEQGVKERLTAMKAEYLPKPVSRESLLRAVSRLLRLNERPS